MLKDLPKRYAPPEMIVENVMKIVTFEILINNCMIKNEFVTAEIMWDIHQFMTHYSSRSFGTCCDIFKIMFPRDETTNKFSMYKYNLGYQILYGLCLFFSQEFDKPVHIRDLSATFSGPATAEDLLMSFFASIVLDVKKMLEVSRHISNFILKFLKVLNFPVIGLMYLCSLYTVNGAYRNLHLNSEWNLKLLLSLHYCFEVFQTQYAAYQHNRIISLPSEVL
ncbi:hypothetical protein PR048_013708 [Dryococelus australis]|uniref:Uncharacterized protein n=1 Tax=Dryococelus australis TaxID=614101 RepID=A0ABQ9HSX8_9NEOP|nr:hypothetical protein PR048_013708 [Dryococelus australis]